MAAIEARSSLNIDVRWQPFQLSPNDPSAGTDYMKTMAELFGGDSILKRELAGVVKLGESVGLEIDFEKIPNMPDTLLSLCLLDWAESADQQDVLFEKIYSAHFCEGLDIGDVDVLVDIGQSAGFDREKLKGMFADQALIDRTSSKTTAGRRAGVNSTPTFVINNEKVVKGAYDSNSFTKLFDELVGA